MEEIKKWKEEVMELIKQKESIEKENCRLKEEASRQEEHATNLGKRLVEEEMNGRRLGIEVQSLKGQLKFAAERQLRQNEATELTQMAIDACEGYTEEGMWCNDNNGFTITRMGRCGTGSL